MTTATNTTSSTNIVNVGGGCVSFVPFGVHVNQQRRNKQKQKQMIVPWCQEGQYSWPLLIRQQQPRIYHTNNNNNNYYMSKQRNNKIRYNNSIYSFVSILFRYSSTSCSFCSIFWTTRIIVIVMMMLVTIVPVTDARSTNILSTSSPLFGYKHNHPLSILIKGKQSSASSSLLLPKEQQRRNPFSYNNNNNNNNNNDKSNDNKDDCIVSSSLSFLECQDQQKQQETQEQHKDKENNWNGSNAPRNTIISQRHQFNERMRNRNRNSKNNNNNEYEDDFDRQPQQVYSCSSSSSSSSSRRNIARTNRRRRSSTSSTDAMVLLASSSTSETKQLLADNNNKKKKRNIDSTMLSPSSNKVEGKEEEGEVPPRELTVLGRVVVGTVSVAVTVFVEYITGFVGGYFLGTLVGMPGWFLKPLGPGPGPGIGPTPISSSIASNINKQQQHTIQSITNQLIQRTQRMNVRAYKWGTSWGTVSSTFRGLNVLSSDVFGIVDTDWNAIVSSFLAGAIFARKDGPQAMLRGAIMYGGLTYILSGGPTKKQLFRYQDEKVIEF